MATITVGYGVIAGHNRLQKEVSERLVYLNRVGVQDVWSPSRRLQNVQVGKSPSLHGSGEVVAEE
jgi:hypothetical protein